MRIWWQAVTSTKGWPEYKKAVIEYANKVADPGTVVESYGTPTAVGGEEYDSVRYLDVVGVLSNAIKAERLGYDAFTIGNTLDAGLREARELINIPVVGHLQTSLHVMSTMARNFSMIVPHRKFIPTWEHLVGDYGFRDRLVSIEGMDIGVTDYEKLYTDKAYGESHLESFITIAHKAVTAGAEMIFAVPAPMVIGFLRVAQKDHLEVEGVPVFDSIPAVIKMTELMVKFRQLTGVFISRKLTYASPPKELVEEIIARHKLQVTA